MYYMYYRFNYISIIYNLLYAAATEGGERGKKKKLK